MQKPHLLNWKPEYFEIRFENFKDNKRYFYKFDGDGLRYELAEFTSMINKNIFESYKLKSIESTKISEIIELFIKGKNLEKIY